ncbi:hypothetical protein HPB52_009243 [Rhipicephalus sanguineus]|uniref:Ig-like domain-containing protein n=1 Tax=Rhipicephalus sanguineus TaxID=34632 RepID=A0A9D4YML8_RHISA|nr:hypothetical protein HPB52_009243 [Rhipicephalus sanguineus]
MATQSEPPLLLQWYRGSQLIYSVDSENVPLVQARHTVHGGAREERRLHVSVGRRPYRLSLGHVQPEDEDVYFCLVSFPSGTSINASVSLVIVEVCRAPGTKAIGRAECAGLLAARREIMENERVCQHNRESFLGPENPMLTPWRFVPFVRLCVTRCK